MYSQKHIVGFSENPTEIDYKGPARSKEYRNGQLSGVLLVDISFHRKGLGFIASSFLRGSMLTPKGVRCTCSYVSLGIFGYPCKSSWWLVLSSSS